MGVAPTAGDIERELTGKALCERGGLPLMAESAGGSVEAGQGSTAAFAHDPQWLHGLRPALHSGRRYPL